MEKFYKENGYKKIFFPKKNNLSILKKKNSKCFQNNFY